MGWIFIPSGISKLLDNATTTRYIETTTGLPMASLLGWATGVFEIAFSLAIIFGFQTRVAGILLAAFCVLTAVLFHAGKDAAPGLSEQAVVLIAELHFFMVFKNIAIAGGLLALAMSGPGAWSLDRYRSRRSQA